MALRIAALTGAAALATLASAPVLAQDAAESAIILSGTGAGQAKAQRSLGAAVRGSIEGAATTVRGAARGQGSPRGRAPSGNGVVVSGTALAADSDPLENTDAPAYRLGNGATIRVSGRMNPAAGTSCVKNCAAPAATGPDGATQQPQPTKP